jgi:hypothetical protein
LPASPTRPSTRRESARRRDRCLQLPARAGRNDRWTCLPFRFGSAPRERLDATVLLLRPAAGGRPCAGPARSGRGLVRLARPDGRSVPLRSRRLPACSRSLHGAGLPGARGVVAAGACHGDAGGAGVGARPAWATPAGAALGPAGARHGRRACLSPRCPTRPAAARHLTTADRARESSSERLRARPQCHGCVSREGQ